MPEAHQIFSATLHQTCRKSLSPPSLLTYSRYTIPRSAGKCYAHYMAATLSPFVPEDIITTVEIKWTPKEGRFLVASRDISAGEVVFTEAPLVVAPKPEAGSTCLACLAVLQEAWEVCGGCGAPLCLPRCDAKHHTDKECNILACFGLKQDPTNRVLMKQLNVLLAPLRTLLLVQESQGAGAIVAALQSNTTKRRKLPIGRLVEEQVTLPLQRELGLQVESELVQHVCGVLDTNTFIIRLSKDRYARALFSLGSLMNHSCVPNTQHWCQDGMLTVRAARDIREGTPITITYAPTLWGTYARAAYLASSKLFTCTCERCLDPVELGSHISSVWCRECHGGLLVPASDPQAPWVCQTCGSKVCAAAVEALVRAAGVAVSRVPQDDVAAISTTMKHLAKVLGSCHYITVELKYALVLATMTPTLTGRP
nr:SET domain-containing protein SmydA-8-like [Cherax quadricarinatus]